MERIILQIFSCFLGLFEVWLCYQLLYCIHLKRIFLSGRDKLVIGFNIFIIGTLLSINRQICFFSSIMFIVCVIITILSVWLIKRKDLLLSAEIVISYFAIVSLLDFLLAFISMIFLKDRFLGEVFFETISISQIMIFFGTRVIVAIGIWRIKKNAGKGDNIEEYKKLLLVVSILLCVILRVYQYFVAGIAMYDFQMRADYTGASLLTIMVLVGIGFVVMQKSATIRKENEFLLVRDELRERKMQDVEKLLDENRILVHDIKNHLAILEGYSKENNMAGLSQYLAEISQQYNGIEIYSWTGNRILDMLLSQKKREALAEDIAFDIQAVPMINIRLSEAEICALFGNLLDNAIEACRSLEEKGRWIIIKMEKKNQILFIEIKNSIGKKPVVKNGELITSKSDYMKHGYGIKSVKRIVEKYEGDFTYQTENDKFQVNLSFFDMYELV